MSIKYGFVGKVSLFLALPLSSLAVYLVSTGGLYGAVLFILQIGLLGFLVLCFVLGILFLLFGDV